MTDPKVQARLEELAQQRLRLVPEWQHSETRRKIDAEIDQLLNAVDFEVPDVFDLADWGQTSP